jgi:hypothetical protein
MKTTQREIVLSGAEILTMEALADPVLRARIRHVEKTCSTVKKRMLKIVAGR